MAVGQIEQQLYARGLPAGVKMLITDVSFKTPDGEWWPGFQGPHHSIYKNTSDDEKRSILPMEVSNDYRNGYIGTAYLSSQSTMDKGAGPEIYLKFKLSGTSSVDDKAIDFGNVNGFITISTTDWGWMERPDYCNVSYSIQDGQPRNLPNEIQVMVAPHDISFVFAARPSKSDVGMNASTDEDVIKDLAIYALRGIMMANEKAMGWVVGKLW